MSALFGSKPKAPEPIRMPVEGDADSRAAAERQRRAISGRSGRSSTVMTPRSRGAEAGTTSYTNSVLGQAG